MVVLPLEGNAHSVWHGGQIKDTQQLAYFEVRQRDVLAGLSQAAVDKDSPAKMRRSALIHDLAQSSLEGAQKQQDNKPRIARAKMIAQLAEAAAKDKPKPKPKPAPKPSPASQSSSGSPSGGQFVANISAYTAAFDETDSGDGITASGKRVKANHTIACPRSYAFGTRIKVEGYGTYTCEDRGGAIKGNKFDIYVVTKSEAFSFGRRNLTVSVVQ